MVEMPKSYHNRYDPDKNYEEHLFLSGSVLQNAEMNEIQHRSANRIKNIADALFSDGNVVRDAQIVVNKDTGFVQCEAGVVYVRGDMRGVPPAQFTVPVVGTVVVGVRLRETLVTYQEDAELRDPAIGLRNYRKPGAARLRVEPFWSFEGDGQEGELYPIYTIDDGYLRAKEPPPTIDMVSLSLAKYDRDSAGGTYVVSGFQVHAEDDLPDGRQVYVISEGRARCYGHAIETPTSRRIVFDPQPFARTVYNEPHLAQGGNERVDTDRWPVSNVREIQVTKEKTATITHGSYLGVSDPLPDTSVISIQEVKQGTKTYVHGTDYKLNAGMVDWSLSGDEPATGSTYQVTYRYVATFSPSDFDGNGFDVSDAVADTLIYTTYQYLVPRVDRLCINQDGKIVWVKGTSADWNPFPPEISRELLPLAQITQTWDERRTVKRDGARTVPMDELDAIQGKLDRLIELTAQERLKGDINLREAGLKKSVFVDPFLGDDMRDQGIEQTGAIVTGMLMLPITADASYLPNDISPARFLDGVPEVVLEQPKRTGEMKINPYMAFDPIPAEVLLTPETDFWTTTNVTWTSPVTSLFIGIGTINTTEVLSVTKSVIEYLRKIDVAFELRGFGPGEEVTSVQFDGIPVAIDPL